MSVKKLIAIFAISLLILVSSVFALQQTVGKLVVYVRQGESNSTYYGLTNEGNETITVKLRSEGNISDFVEFPNMLELPPKKFIPVIVNVSVPIDYDYSKGNNITGYIFALLEGKPGQVQINVQTRKTLDIIVQESGSVVEAQFPLPSITGLFSTSVSIPFFGFALIGILLFVGLILLIKRKRR
jgi:hypothetical protein